MGVPNSQLTTIFSANYQLTTVFSAKYQLTVNLTSTLIYRQCSGFFFLQVKAFVLFKRGRCLL